MGFRQIYIKTAFELRLENNNLKIVKLDENVLLPLEDINSILLEDSKTMISSRLMTELSKYSINLILCNEKYMPTANLLPMNYYYNEYSTLKLQLKISKKLQEKLWELIIKQKINNQKRVIELTSGDLDAIQLLDMYSRDVKTNDSANREAVSAKVFLIRYMGKIS